MDEYFVEEKSGFDRLMDFLVFIAVFVVTIFLILEIFGWSGRTSIDPAQVNEIYLWVSFVVFAIFVVDLVRLYNKEENFSDFLKHNWLDILATVPFELIAFYFGTLEPDTVSKFAILKWFRVGRVARIARVSKISKEFKAAAHLKKESEEYKKKHRL